MSEGTWLLAHHNVTAAHSCVRDIKPTKARHLDTGSKRRGAKTTMTYT